MSQDNNNYLVCKDCGGHQWLRMEALRVDNKGDETIEVDGAIQAITREYQCRCLNCGKPAVKGQLVNPQVKG